MLLVIILFVQKKLYKISLIKDEISKLRIEQQKYYVPSILERAVYNENKDNNSLEKSFFSLVKQIKANFNHKNRKSGNNNEYCKNSFF